MSIGISDLITTLANPYGVIDTNSWHLQKGSFLNAQGQSVMFFIEKRSGQDSTQQRTVDQISDSAGRRLTVYEYPYLDGQALDDLGRKGEKFTFNIKFFGTNYQVLYKQFINVVVNSSGQGTLTHPVRGAIKCRFLEYEFIHRYDEWNAVTIRASFLEDNTGQIQANNLTAASSNSILRSALSTVVNIVATATNTLFALKAALSLPTAVFNSLNLRIQSINDAVSSFLGQLAATFSTDSQLKLLAFNFSTTTGGLTALNAGTTTSGSQIPPVYQVGFTQTEQNSINAQLTAFVNANQITSQQAIYTANTIRTTISAAILEVTNQLGNDGFDLVLLYRQLAVSIQETTQNCISSTQPTIQVYTVPFLMSLRKAAYLNGLTVDRQNDIEALNPYLASVNYVPQNTILLIPAS